MENIILEPTFNHVTTWFVDKEWMANNIFSPLKVRNSNELADIMFSLSLTQMIWANIHLLNTPVDSSSSVYHNRQALSSETTSLCSPGLLCHPSFSSCGWCHLPTGHHATSLLSSLMCSIVFTGWSPNSSEWHTCTFCSLSTGGDLSSHLMLHLSPAFPCYLEVLSSTLSTNNDEDSSSLPSGRALVHHP